MAMHCSAALIFLLGFLYPSSALIGSSTLPDYRLLHDLLDGYDPAVCPRSSAGDPVEIYVEYVLMSVNVVDEKSQVITINGWLNLNWTDAMLQWDPALYEGVDMIVIPSKRVWLPDLAFENGIDKLFYDFSNFAVTVYSDGSVVFVPGGPLTLSCSLVLTNFPFDTQLCNLIVISWTTPERTMIYNQWAFTKDLLVENGEWTILDLNATYTPFSSEGETYSEIYMNLLLQRKPWYQILNTILPVIMFSFLNLAVFRLPSDSGEKVSLSITVLLAYSVWLLMMSSIMPTTSDNLPLLGTFITILMSISTLSVFVTVFIIRLDLKPDTQPIPNWMKKLLCIHQRLCLRANSVKQIDTAVDQAEVCEEKINWKMVASAADRSAFYLLLSITILVMIIAVGRIGAMVAAQPSSLQH